MPVELTQKALQARLRAGKVDPSDRVDAALLNFFTTSNLGTCARSPCARWPTPSTSAGTATTPGPGVVLQGAPAPLAEERGVTRLALARPGRRGVASRLRGDLLSTLLERLEGVDVLLIADRRRRRGEE